MLAGLPVRGQPASRSGRGGLQLSEGRNRGGLRRKVRVQPPPPSDRQRIRGPVPPRSRTEHWALSSPLSKSGWFSWHVSPSWSSWVY